ncbi:hypothetical protein VTN00DRAFT_6854 [Thermoascus crustaceus]
MPAYQTARYGPGYDVNPSCWVTIKRQSVSPRCLWTCNSDCHEAYPPD